MILYKFSNGYCYYFSIMLNTRFPDGEIWYDLIENHFIFKLENNFYDINGNITSEHLNNSSIVKWDDYNDDSHKQRIIKYSIMN